MSLQEIIRFFYDEARGYDEAGIDYQSDAEFHRKIASFLEELKQLRAEKNLGNIPYREAMELKEITENVYYWETCPKEYKETIARICKL